jgi:guanosine-3',5'-bis(diphosphate) 3'-pyrophosphohydrolase
MTGLPLWHHAAAMAARAHRDQLRKDDRTPYVAHPFRVALTVAVLFGCTDETVLAAAVLHDIIEDSTIDYDDLLESAGPEVADLVAALSKDPRLVEPEREVAYDRQLADAPTAARLIKLADVWDNLQDAETADSRRKLLGKARRALDLAAGEAELERACDLVRALVERVERETEQGEA